MDAFSAYQKYLALKRHFSSDYDYFKYGGKVSAKPTSFEVRKDKYMFHKLSKVKDVEGFLVSNFLHDDNIWIGNLFNTEASSRYTEWLKRQQSLSYTLQNDLDKLDDDVNENFLVKNGEYPQILKLYMRNEISIETLIICNDVFNFFKYWNAQIEDPVCWPDIYKKCVKYKPFLKYDKTNCKQIIKRRFV